MFSGWELSPRLLRKMPEKKRIASLLLLLFALACVSTLAVQRQKRLARELVTDVPSFLAASGFSDEVVLDQPTIEFMRSLAGDRLLAILHLRRGVHPFWVFTFLRDEDTIEVVITKMSWGEVQTKWVAETTAERLESLRDQATGTFDCSEGILDGTAFSDLFIHWPNGGQVVCDGGWLSEEGAAFAEHVDPILQSARRIYGLAADGGAPHGH